MKPAVMQLLGHFKSDIATVVPPSSEQGQMPPTKQEKPESQPKK
jgi:hypothetical protein